MSFHVFFSFSTGLTKPLKVPAGTLAAVNQHIMEVEETLGLKRTTYGEGEDAHISWDTWDDEFRKGFPSVDDKVLCETVSRHNAWVRNLYERVEEWSKRPVKDGEKITPADAAQFWCGLRELTVAPSRWTREYYTDRMEHIYDVMRGRQSEGVSLDVKALTPKQAANVIRIFERYLDSNDCRLDVPHGHDYLASSYDGGYDWCGTCGRAMIWEDAMGCNRRKCELKEQANN